MDKRRKNTYLPVLPVKSSYLILPCDSCIFISVHLHAVVVIPVLSCYFTAVFGSCHLFSLMKTLFSLLTIAARIPLKNSLDLNGPDLVK